MTTSQIFRDIPDVDNVEPDSILSIGDNSLPYFGKFFKLVLFTYMKMSECKYV